MSVGFIRNGKPTLENPGPAIIEPCDEKAAYDKLVGPGQSCNNGVSRIRENNQKFSPNFLMFVLNFVTFTHFSNDLEEIFIFFKFLVDTIGQAILQLWVPGKLTCETRNNKRGYRKICTVKCSDGKKRKGPQRTRCKNYNNTGGIAYKYWHTNMKERKMNCN